MRIIPPEARFELMDDFYGGAPKEPEIVEVTGVKIAKSDFDVMRELAVKSRARRQSRTEQAADK
jgi:hypothetical protein